MLTTSSQLRLLAAGLVAVVANGCVTKPVDGQEVSSRSSTIQFEMVYPEGQLPYVSKFHLDPSGATQFTEQGGLVNRAYLMTDATGKRWWRGVDGIWPHMASWYLNNDPNHPWARWKKRIRFRYSNNGTIMANMTFRGLPNGELTPATIDCMNSYQSQGGIVVATFCGQGDTITIYALND